MIDGLKENISDGTSISNSTSVRFSKVSKTFGDQRVLDKINLEIEDRENYSRRDFQTMPLYSIV